MKKQHKTEVNRVDRLIFVFTSSLNILIYSNQKKGLDTLYQEIIKLDEKSMKFDNILDKVEEVFNNIVLLNKADVDIMKTNSSKKLDLFKTDDKSPWKYILTTN
ncbi:MAG: hypothetical protein U5K53_11345 [Halanaerobiales bacterium]|nr:hypothetical protein [Halanaerobiales bacterium]